METLYYLQVDPAKQSLATDYVAGEKDEGKTSPKATFYKTFNRDTGALTRYLYKEYTDPTAEVRVRIEAYLRYLDYINGSNNLRFLVPALPLLAVQRTDGDDFGVLIENLQYSNTVSLEYAKFTPLTLKERLLVASHLARQVALFHLEGIIHCDLTDKNILYHGIRLRKPIDIIDMDWSAVKDVNSPSGYRKHLYTLSYPPITSFYRSPDMSSFNKSLQEAGTIESDLWSLAVAIHRILLTPFDPLALFVGMSQEEKFSTQLRWPPLPEKGEEKLVSRHRTKFIRLDVPLMDLFKRVFDRPQHTAFIPYHRPTAFEWVQTLEEAMNATHKCAACGGWYVGLLDRHCPVCIPEGTVRIYKGRRVSVAQPL